MTSWTLLELKNGSGSIYNTVGLTYNSSGVYYDYLHLLANWAKPTKSSTTFSLGSKTTSGGQVLIGKPVGLLLALTYAQNTGASTTAWTLTNKN
jgi:hypothetical protein